MLTLPFKILTWLCFNGTKLLQKLNRNLTEEENSSQSLKILTQITVEDENELAEREVFPKTINEQILRQASLPFAVFFFFLQGQTEERWKRLLDRHSVGFPKYSSVTLKS